MYKLGWRPDPFKRPSETPDHDAATRLSALPPPPDEATARELVVDILDQGSLGSCTTNAVGQAVRASHVRQGVLHPKLLSRLFAYWWARAYDHTTNEDAGAHLRNVCAALNKFGFCPEELWPYDDGPERFKRMPDMRAASAAFDQRSPTTYTRIYETGNARVDMVKRAIAAKHLVVFGTDVSVDFASNRGTDVPIPPPKGLSIAGGHAMCWCDYDKNDTFGVVNSWSDKWGQNGFARFTAEYVAWDNTRDIWIIEHSPKFSAP